jgi:3-methyladenine DNA glycosylase/8-oxoguanine DNA glycosylase
MRLKSLYSFELRPREPFDFHLMASCYNFNWWFDGSKCIVPLSSLSPLVAVTRQEELRLVVTVYGMRDWPEDVVKMVEHALGINEDLAEFYRVAERDPLLYEVPKTLSGMRLRATSLSNAMLIAICQQNASFAQGWKMLCRIYKLMGKRVELDGLTTIIPPTPRDILADSARRLLKEAGLGYRAETIVRVAETIERGLLEGVEELNDEEAEERLREIKGVGAYTARLALVLSQRRYGLLPLDRWLEKIAREVYRLDDVEVGLKTRWGRLCGLAVFFTTVVLDAEVLSKALKRALTGNVKPTLQRGKLSPLTLWMYEVC